MSDDDGLTEEDLVTWDDFPEAVADALEDSDVDVSEGSGDFDPEDAPWLEPDDAAEITERKMTEFMHHLTHESCETPECQQFRDAIGIAGESEPDGGPSSEGGSDADGGADAGNEDDESGGESDSSESQETESESESGDSTEESDPSQTGETSESDSSDPDDAETNYLGEEI